MRILLVGEYSGLHNSLKTGLQRLGHEVTIIGTGDGFKNYKVDIPLTRKYCQGLGHLLKVLTYRLTGIDLAARSIYRQFCQQKELLKDYDAVQLINECSFKATPHYEKKIISYLKQYNKKLFLLSCGADYPSVHYAHNKKPKYSILTPYFQGKENQKSYNSVLKYLKPKYKAHSEWLHQTVDGIIASDLDYHIPLNGRDRYLGLIPNPIDLEKLKMQKPSNKSIEKPHIFLGINRTAYYKKGTDYFEKALNLVQAKYKDNITITKAENLPYDEYIQVFSDCHILLDQVLSYDQGYNALEAMAMGKVVFTGAETEFYAHYALKEKVAINALPDVQYLADELGELIEHPERIHTIGQAAQNFVKTYHDCKEVAQIYLETWAL